ncbi:protein PROCA1 [Spea bombifrons]|uniref:protein PROCA1 n=1 Tax=Spea bombifrons TaxID=233779 RepID=UPI00234939F1|nr:protein PROCA1 [Spea bombifrons]
MREIPALLLTSVISAVLGVPNESSVQGCAMISSQGELIQHQVTDGRGLVTSTWDSRRQLVSCSVDMEEQEVLSFLSRCLAEKQQVPGDWGSVRFAEVRLACQIFQSVFSPWDKANTIERHLHRAKRGFTYPGTLWCGSGNIAESFDDLGEHKETDTCCRTHDQCEHVIHPFSYNYGYRNMRWHTISHCQCDAKFKECLRKVNNTASRVVGQAFFNVIQVPCFEFTFKELCIERHWYGWCKTYSNEKVAVSKDSGLYDYGGELIDHVTEGEKKKPTMPPFVEPLPGQPTLRSVVLATEDLLKLMMTVSPSTSSDLSKAESTIKKKKKERKHKNGKGLKGKRGKGLKGKRGKGLKGKKTIQLANDNVTSPAKVLWGENIVKNEIRLSENQHVDTMLDLGGKQDPFNDVLNDEPIKNEVTHVPFQNYEQSINTTTILPEVFKPFSEKPQKKSRPGRKQRYQRNKKPKTDSSVPEDL